MRASTFISRHFKKEKSTSKQKRALQKRKEHFKTEKREAKSSHIFVKSAHAPQWWYVVAV